MRPLRGGAGNYVFYDKILLANFENIRAAKEWFEEREQLKEAELRINKGGSSERAFAATKDDAISFLRGIVECPDAWLNAGEGAGECWAYIAGGCEFRIYPDTDINAAYCAGVTHPTFSSIDDFGYPTEDFFRFAPRPLDLGEKTIAPFTREELIRICENAIVPVEKWNNRDTPAAQRNVGIAWGLLLNGREFSIERFSAESDVTIWLTIEGGTFYLPTPARLERSKGEDWY